MRSDEGSGIRIEGCLLDYKSGKAALVMKTDQILNLFNVKARIPRVQGQCKSRDGDVESNSMMKGGTNVLEGLGGLWDETKYRNMIPEICLR